MTVGNGHSNISPRPLCETKTNPVNSIERSTQTPTQTTTKALVIWCRIPSTAAVLYEVYGWTDCCCVVYYTAVYEGVILAADMMSHFHNPFHDRRLSTLMP